MAYFIPAYLLIWLLLMGYTLFLHQKQSKLQRTLEFVRTVVDKRGRG